MSGFRAPGIYPFNRDVFTDDDLATSFVTDRQVESEAPTTSAAAINQVLSGPSTSSVVATPHSLNPSKTITPEQVRPYPKAGPRKTNG